MNCDQKFSSSLTLTQTIRKIIRERTAVENLEDELTARVNAENVVRKIKRAGKKCPHEMDGLCNRIEIRCGERQQFSLPEDMETKHLPHKCNYQPKVRLNEFNVLVVDDEKTVLDLCAEFFEAMGIPKARIEKAESVEGARDILNQGKILNKQYCVVLSDIKLKKDTGFQLVNHLVERNFNSRILLMSGFVDESDFPRHYLGDKEIIPGKKVVSCFFKKPITFSDFTNSIKNIEEEFQPN
jgi:CheY-like chemotaxis protein